MPEIPLEPDIVAELLTASKERLGDAARDIIIEIAEAKPSVGTGHVDAYKAIVEEAMRRFRYLRGIK